MKITSFEDKKEAIFNKFMLITKFYTDSMYRIIKVRLGQEMNLTAEGPLKPVFDAAKNLHNEFVKLEKDMIASGTDLKGYYQALINTVKQQDLKPQNEKQD